MSPFPSAPPLPPVIMPDELDDELLLEAFPPPIPLLLLTPLPAAPPAPAPPPTPPPPAPELEDPVPPAGTHTPLSQIWPPGQGNSPPWHLLRHAPSTQTRSPG